MPRTKQKKTKRIEEVELPKGFYLNNRFWYVRIHKPHPQTGVWGMIPESTGCKADDKAGALAYKKRRDEELGNSRRLGHKLDPGSVVMNELFNDLLAHEHGATKEVYEWVIFGAKRKDGTVKEKAGMLSKFFGPMLAKDVTVHTCKAYRELRRNQGVQQTTINRELSNVSMAFKLGMKCGKATAMPPGGCDFFKKPETENTRRVRLPDKYYASFRDALATNLRCLYVVGYNIGRRKSELLRLRWDRVDFDEGCIYFEKTKFGPGKAPFFGEMENYLLEQKRIRDERYPDCPYVFFWFDYRSDKNGHQIGRFDEFWDQAVEALNKKRMKDKQDPIDLHFHDLRRSAHHMMRKAKIDPQTRRDIMGHKTNSMDDRYTMIDDEDLDDARKDMRVFQTGRGLCVSEESGMKAEIARLNQELADMKHRYELGA